MPKAQQHINTTDFAVTELRIAIELPMDAFVALLDSESYVSGNAAFQPGNNCLSDLLEMAANISDVAYDGHFGNYVFFSVASDVYTDEVKERIVSVINDHLDWCLSLPVRPNVAKRRKEQFA